MRCFVVSYFALTSHNQIDLIVAPSASFCSPHSLRYIFQMTGVDGEGLRLGVPSYFKYLKKESPTCSDEQHTLGKSYAVLCVSLADLHTGARDSVLQSHS